MFRRFITILTITLIAAASALADDVILLRNGEELNGKVSLITDTEIYFTAKEKKGLLKSLTGIIRQDDHKGEQVLPASEIYMIKSDKRGNTFFDAYGNRSQKTSPKRDKSATTLYLVSGDEIPCWELTLEHGIYSFRKDKKLEKQAGNVGAYPKEDIFMIVYPDGTHEIITDLRAGIMEASPVPDAPPMPPMPKNKKKK